MLLTHWARRAASRAACTAGRSRAIRTAMMAITTSSSISVKPRGFLRAMGNSLRKEERAGIRRRQDRPVSRDALRGREEELRRALQAVSYFVAAFFGRLC